jgi:NAD(P)-dependent dehydrogenase (short-subunit alcohol dehydrogenase family)
VANEFEGRTALVTGGGTGVGRASAIALAKKGALVTAAGNHRRALEETVKLVEAAGGLARWVVCDVTDEASVRAAVEAAVEPSGRLDIAVNAAGISRGDGHQKTGDYPTEMFDRIVAADLRSTFLSMKYELQKMQVQGFGSIVNVNSTAGLAGAAGFSGYSAAEHGVIGLTRTAALDYRGQGIRINAITAGLIDAPAASASHLVDPRTARVAGHLWQVAQASEIAAAIVWLCSDQSSLVTGVALPIDGGYAAA